MLGRIAFDCRVTGDIPIERELIFKYATTDPLKKTLNDSGFLLLKEEGTKYQFPHLTILEHFAGLHLLHSLFKKNVPDENRTQEISFISTQKYKDVHKATFSFMIQESAKKKLPALSEIFAIVDQEPLDIFGMQHLFLKVNFKQRSIPQSFIGVSPRIFFYPRQQTLTKKYDAIENASKSSKTSPSIPWRLQET